MNPKEIPKKLEDDLKNVKYYRKRDENVLNYQHSSDDLHHPPLRKVFDDSAESKMYDEIFGGLLNSKSKLPAGSGFDATRRSSSQEKDFTSSLIQHLKVVESEAKESRKRLAEELAKNIKLEDEISILKVAQSNGKLVEQMQHLQRENTLLKKEVYEMKEFLADYGLEWVGNGNISLDSAVEEDSTLKHIVDFETLQKCITKLNQVLYEEPAQIVTDKNSSRKARLVHAGEIFQKMQVTYFQDGLLINRGPFRPCNSASYHTFVQDIIDGYFPSELREEFPDGVIFDLIDKRSVMYASDLHFLSSKDFLAKLPKNIIKDGEIFDIQKDLKLKLKKEEDRQCLPSDNRNRIVKLSTDLDDETLPRTTIHIKWKNGITLHVEMYAMATVGNLIAIIRKELSESNEFELRTTFPPKLLHNDETFIDANLFPNGFVHTKFL